MAKQSGPFIDNGSGKPSGILVDIPNRVALAEHWQLDQVRCEWQACLASLARGEIDLLPDVAGAQDQVRDAGRDDALRAMGSCVRANDVGKRSGDTHSAVFAAQARRW